MASVLVVGCYRVLELLYLFEQTLLHLLIITVSILPRFTIIINIPIINIIIMNIVVIIIIIVVVVVIVDTYKFGRRV